MPHPRRDPRSSNSRKGQLVQTMTSRLRERAILTIIIREASTGAEEGVIAEEATKVVVALLLMTISRMEVSREGMLQARRTMMTFDGK